MTITPILSNAVNGLHKNAQRVHESAHRIVNFQSLPSPAEAVTGQAVLGGDNAVQAQGLRGNTNDLAIEFVNMIQAEHAYRASAEVLRRAEDLSDTLNDILA